MKNSLLQHYYTTIHQVYKSVFTNYMTNLKDEK